MSEIPKINWAAARVNANLTQREVAEMMKITPATLVSWENYKTEMSINQARQLSEIYGYPLEFIKTM